jgi:hypothetical protein
LVKHRTRVNEAKPNLPETDVAEFVENLWLSGKDQPGRAERPAEATAEKQQPEFAGRL